MKKMIFTPGRTELAGNHTDHQKGRILAAGVALGLTAVYEANDTNLVSIHSAGYERFEIKLNQLVRIQRGNHQHAPCRVRPQLLGCFLRSGRQNPQ